MGRPASFRSRLGKVPIESTPASQSLSQASGIPNVVWSFWAQGTANLPPIIQTCIDTWRQNGGAETIYVLDSKSVSRFLSWVELPRTFLSLTPQMQSDAVRLAILAKYGGIWLDASTLVTKTLMPWLEKVSRGKGLFLFQNPSEGRGGRLFEIGFIGATPAHPLLEAWSREFNQFFSRNRIHLAHSPESSAPWLSKKLFAFLNQWLRTSPERSSLWARNPLSALPFYPYFITYYIANKLKVEEGAFHYFNQMENIDSREYLRLRGRINSGDIEGGLEEARSSKIPVHDIEFRYGFNEDDILIFHKFIYG